MNKKLLTTGITGTILAALCCFTPLLVVLLSGIGLSAAIAWLDLILIPLLVFFIGLTIYALVAKRKTGDSL